MVSLRHPEGAIAFKEDYVLDQLAQRGLQLQGDIHRGLWVQPGGHFFQDYTVADKAV